MAKHFLYLPLYYAKEMDFFGYLPGYDLRIVLSEQRTDESAYEMLMTPALAGHENIAFAVADPTCANLRPARGDRTAAILGGLITNAAFWAVDRGTFRLVFLQDLGQFDKIIAFEPGTTSYGIAARIFRDASKNNDGIITVKPGDELLKLTSSEPGTVALTPDILEAQAVLKRSTEFEIDLPLGTTPEYSNVLVTALISRHDILTDQPELAKGLMKALLRAVTYVRLQDSSIVTFAAEYFGKDHVLVEQALSAASSAQVYTHDLTVTEANWIHAARAGADARGQEFNWAEKAKARQIYDQICNPYVHLGRSVLKDVLRDVAKDLEPPELSNVSSHVRRSTSIRNWLHFGIAGLFGTIGALGGVLLGLATAVLGSFIENKVRLTKTGELIAHWSFLILVAGIILAWWRFNWSAELTIGTIATIVVAEISLLVFPSRGAH